MTRKVDQSSTTGVKYNTVKLLANGASGLKQPIDIEVSKASKRAIDAIEAAGGQIVTVYESSLSMRGKLKPLSVLKKGRALPRRPQPRSEKDHAYYTDYANRGYLSPEIQLRKQKQKLGLH